MSGGNPTSSFTGNITISNVKYGDDISAVWPSETTGSFSATGGGGFVGWRGLMSNSLPFETCNIPTHQQGELTNTRSHRYKAEGLAFRVYNEGSQDDNKWRVVTNATGKRV